MFRIRDPQESLWQSQFLVTPKKAKKLSQNLNHKCIDRFLEVWPESHWPGFALHQADVFQSYTAW